MRTSACPVGAHVGQAAGTCCGSGVGGKWQAYPPPPAGREQGQADPSSGWVRATIPWKRAGGSPQSQASEMPKPRHSQDDVDSAHAALGSVLGMGWGLEQASLQGLKGWGGG